VKVYFDNPELDGQFLRALDYAPLGAQIGEAWARQVFFQKMFAWLDLSLPDDRPFIVVHRGRSAYAAKDAIARFDSRASVASTR
jgi:hypothetical protein